MKTTTTLRRMALAAALLAGLAAPAVARIPFDAPGSAATAPGASLYQLDTVLTDGAGQRFTLREMAGAPLLVTMFYGDCHAACPIIIETLKRTVAALGAAGKPLRVVLVSLDPSHDTPASLAMLAGKHDLDSPQFRLSAAADESQTRTMAAALDIKYRRLDNGEINHTTRVVLLDANGNQVASSSRLEVTPDPVFVKQIAALLKK